MEKNAMEKNAMKKIAMETTISYGECLKTLKFNRGKYGRNFFEAQLSLVAALFKCSIAEVEKDVKHASFPSAYEFVAYESDDAAKQ